MKRGLCVIGTGTDVGKTVVSAALCTLARSRGDRVTYFKPVLSGAVQEGNRLIPGDTRFVCETAGLQESWEVLTPCIYRNPLSPHLAARLEGRPVDRERIGKAFLDLACRYDTLIVEAAGGLAVPLDDEGFLMADLLQEFGLPTLLVASAGLGTINHTVLSVEYARSKGISLLGVLLNGGRGEPCEADNATQIARLTGLPVYGPLPHMDSLEGPSLMEALGNILPPDFFISQEIKSQRQGKRK